MRANPAVFSLLGLSLTLLLGACSPTQSPPAPGESPPQPQADQAHASQPVIGLAAPSNALLGSPQWYAWVDETLEVSDHGHTPDGGSPTWNAAVQHRLGQEAPQSPVGSPEWQQAVDSLLRTRAPGNG